MTMSGAGAGRAAALQWPRKAPAKRNIASLNPRTGGGPGPPGTDTDGGRGDDNLLLVISGTTHRSCKR